MNRPMSPRIKFLLRVFGWLPFSVFSVRVCRVGDCMVDGIFLFGSENPVWIECDSKYMVKMGG